jgi:hypothetical protein
VCSVAEKNPGAGKDLASQSEELVDLQAHPFNLWDKYRDQILFWGRGDFSGLYLLDVGGMNVPVP